ncbi:MAG: glutaminase A [Acetobacteraceae bacterium]|nr:glutaminase A [Acetobacteraceae bacterium]
MTIGTGLSRRHLLRAASALAITPALAQARVCVAPPDAGRVTKAVNDAHARFAGLTEGKNADYIPYLAGVPSALFGVAASEPDGAVAEAGDVGYALAIESIAKVFTLALVLRESGPEAVQQKLGTNATGLPFNSVMGVELNHGKPISPLVNAGAMATVSLVQAASPEERWNKIIGNMSRFAGRTLTVNEEVYKSEADTNEHNRGIAMLLKSYGFMYTDPMEACDIYTRECSIAVTTHDLAVMAGTLANGGINPVTKEAVIDPALVPPVLSQMAIEGLYENTGDWMFTVGLPAKSGVGGGLIAVAPGVLGLAAFSPPLDAAGNSVRAQKAVQSVVQALGLNIYAG